METNLCADCKAPLPTFPPGHCGGTGYATVQRDATEARICYDCSAKVERDYMIREGRTSLYLNGRGAVYTVTDWPGRLAFRVIGRVRHGQGYGFGGRRYPIRTCRFAGPDGFVWSARCAGDMDIARCRRTRERIAP